ncbi:MFS transporter [Gaoshiqia sp. Z1-71]|uniref:MFS transporter n=1 Tax=Gaoshiqia hydrogeniformans TaxID=3290090 RepID=UPI003BF9017E
MKRTVLIWPVSVMILLGGIYAWSMFVPPLQHRYGLTAAQTQWVFGTVIASFTTAMVGADKLLKRIGFRGMILAAGMLFAAGYTLASHPSGRFETIFVGIGLLSGIGTGLGYMSSLSVPVSWFPLRKGLITGMVSGGFAAGSILLTFWTGWLLEKGTDVLIVFRCIGLTYGPLMIIIALLLPPAAPVATAPASRQEFRAGRLFLLFLSMFLGTFAGLMVIGNLKLIGEGAYANRQLSFAIVLFSLANFSGRLAWGWVSDRFSTFTLLSVALIAQGLSTFLLGHFRFPVAMFYLLVMITGLGFGANFVLFARETAHEFGIHRLGQIYPFIFLGYGLAGIFGPVTGGELFDRFQNFSLSSSISLGASILSLGTFGLQLVLVRNKKELTVAETAPAYTTPEFSNKTLKQEL